MKKLELSGSVYCELRNDGDVADARGMKVE